MTFLFLFLIFSFSLGPKAAPDSQPAELIIFNANIRTMADAAPKAGALASSGGKIIAIGDDKAILALAGPETTKIDAGGRLVLPGFNDAHVHFMAVGNSFSTLDLSDASSESEMLNLIARHTRFLPDGRWILGGRWDTSKWTEANLPGREVIDLVSPNNPVFLFSSDSKKAIANSLALKAAGMLEKPTGAADDDISRDANGNPTGIIKGRAISIMQNVVPSDHTKNWAEIAETATNYAASLGVTSVQDVHSDDQAAIYRVLERQGKLKTRVYDCIPLPEWPKLVDRKKDLSVGAAEFVRTGCLKSFSDGDEAEIPALTKLISEADKAGFQVLIHAIGKSPNNIVLGVFESVSKANGKRDRRFRIEHAQGAGGDAAARFAKVGLIASVQPWLFYRGNGGTSEYAMMMDSGVKLALGSDAPITDFNPLFAIYAAVNGSDNGKRQALTVEQAVKAYTAGSAFAEFQENIKGTLEPGKFADVVILSADIFSIDHEKIKDVKVELTIVNGKIVFSAQ